MRKASDIFDLRRFALLLQRDFHSGYRGVLIAMAAVGGSVIVISALTMFQGPAAGFHLNLFVNLLFIGGYIVTSLAFKEMHQNGRAHLYMTLPGSALEKFGSKLLVTSAGYALGAVVFYTAVAAASEGINRLIFGYGHPFFNPLSREVLLLLAVYLVTQGVFLAGAVFFRRFAFLKTALFNTVVVIALGVVLGLAAWLVAGAPGPVDIQQLDGGTLTIMGRQISPATLDRLTGMARSFWLVIRILFWAALAPAAWLVGYLRLRETEV